MTTPETTQRRDIGPGTSVSRQTATGLAAPPTLRATTPATIAITVGGLNRANPTFRARASRPAAQESPRRPVGACEIVETISDHVNFISPSAGVYMGGVRYFLSNEKIFIYAVRCKKTNLKWEMISIT